jgi:chemotaxis signal transduction protein
MSKEHPFLARTAAELRRAFDEGFAAAPAAAAQEPVDFLAIRAGGGRYALRLVDLAGLAADRAIVPLPSADAALLGIAGAQGQLLPVYRLATLIGAGGSENESRWVAVCGGDEPVALAFAALDGHLRVPAADLFVPPDQRERRFVREAIRLGTEVRSVLDLSSIVAAIRERAGSAGSAGVAATVTGR